MKQVIQNFKTGELYVDNVPVPALTEGFVLVENRFSLISAGTERGTVKVGKASLLGKAKQRPDLVAQVLQNLKKEGLKATLNKVMTKLNSPKALGYSTAGVVLASMDTGGKFKPGDRVACAGQDYASHAEIVSVPQNLVVKIPGPVDFDEAAFTTLGAIAMQGIRQANPTLGENVAVIGLGLLGQLTVQLLKANGMRVFGIDLSKRNVELAIQSGADAARLRNDSNLEKLAENFTSGHGFDKIIITAATPTNDPIVLATQLARKKGVIVLVGAVKTDIPRDPHFYRKELELKMSTSYGPGRYDVQYEENGIDYPYAYVRWTEQRNMEAFLNLLAQKKINVKPLISHIFDIDRAVEAYDLVLGKKQEPYLGILLKYEKNENKHQSLFHIKETKPEGKIITGFIGAGSFAQNYLIPNVKKYGSSLDTVVTSKGITAKNAGEKFGFAKVSSNPQDIFGNNSINTVFIATPHNTHASYSMEALKAGKHVFVEKPLAMNPEELEELRQVYQQTNRLLTVGFNRRFAPVAVKLKEIFRDTGEPKVINIRINAGFIPKEHWTQNPHIGGGRIIGEVCHFIDLMQFFTEARPVSVYAASINTNNEKLTPEDNLTVTLRFDDGSLGNLVYTANGDKALPKEHIEIFSGNMTGQIHDFKSGSLYRNNKHTKLKWAGKGHAQEVKAFLEAVEHGKASPIDFESLYLTTLTTFKILDSLKTGLPQEI